MLIIRNLNLISIQSGIYLGKVKVIAIPRGLISCPNYKKRY